MSKELKVPNDNPFEPIHFAYMVGLVLSDVSLSNYSRHYNILLHCRDILLFNKFKDCLEKLSNNSIQIHNDYKTNSKRIYITDKILFMFLKKYKENPKLVTQFSERQKKSFIEGYFDGDGCLTENKYNRKIVKFTSYNFKLLEIIRKVLKEFGFDFKHYRQDLLIYGNEKAKKFMREFQSLKYTKNRPQFDFRLVQGGQKDTIPMEKRSGNGLVVNIARTKRVTVSPPTKKHECIFSFEEKFVGKRRGIYEPKKGETGYSIKRGDWVCRCGKTRLEFLQERSIAPPAKK